MPKIIDLTVKRFGKLTVIKESGRDKWGNKMYLCKCSCGNEKIIKVRLLVTGKTTSCGCKKQAYNSYYGLSFLNDNILRAL